MEPILADVETASTQLTMKGLVYGGPGKKTWMEVDRPKIIKSTDVIVKMLKTTICGTDLHILKGDVPSVSEGRILGHEGVGVVEETGDAVRNFKPGDHVLISCITSCGKCEYCKKQMYSHCEDGGWILGHLIDGTQAEYVRIPHADNSLYHVPEGTLDDALVMLSDILPTAHEIGVLNGSVKPGETVMIVGAGPVGMAALLTCQFYSPARIIMVDLDDARLEMARQFGATDTLNPAVDDIYEWVREHTKDGLDVSIEAVGIPETFDICQSVIRPGGHIASVGVFGKEVTLLMQKLWSANITLRTGLVNTNTTAMLLNIVKSGAIKPEKLITHRFKMDDIMEAYSVFGAAAREKAMKVLIEV